MYAKLVKESFKDILKPTSKNVIRKEFEKYLGPIVTKWFIKFNNKNNVKLFNFVHSNDKDNNSKKSYIEFYFKQYYFQLYRIKTLKVLPPLSDFYSSPIKLTNYYDLDLNIHKWVSGDFKEWETYLFNMSNIAYPL